MGLYARTSKAAHRRLRRELKEEFAAQKPPAPEPEPPWRPISGYDPFWPVPPVPKTVRPKTLKARLAGFRQPQYYHKFLMNVPLREWNMLMTAAIDMQIPVSLIVRFGYRRFLRSYLRTFRLTKEGEVVRRVTAETMLTRAEIEVLGGQMRGPHKWKRRAEELMQTPREPYENAPVRPRTQTPPPPTPNPKGSSRRRLIVPPKETP